MYGMGRGYLLTVDRGFQTPLIYQDCPILLTSPYCSFVFCCLVSLAEWVIASHLICYLLNDIMDLHILRFGTSVPEGVCLCFMQQGVKFTERVS